MCMSVYLARSADRPTIVGSCSASSTSACPNGAAAVRCPGSAMLAIIAEVLRRGFRRGGGHVSCSCRGRGGCAGRGVPSRSASRASSHSCSSMRMKCAFSRVSRNGTPRPDAGVADDARPGCRPAARDGVESVDQGGDVVAVDARRCASRMPPTCPRAARCAARPGRSVGLQAVHVDDAEQVAEPMVGGGHRGLPGRALVEFAVAHHVDRPGSPLPWNRRPSAMPTRDAQAVAERAAGDLHAGGVGAHARTSAAGSRRSRRSPAPRPGGCRPRPVRRRGRSRSGPWTAAPGRGPPTAGPRAGSQPRVLVDHGQHVGEAEPWPT